MTTPDDVLRLIDQFARQAAYYHSPHYNETQARREFIDPLFEQLGWDVTNRNGQSPDAREVIHEDTVRVRATDTLPALPLLDLLNAGAVPTPEPPTPMLRDGGRKAPDYSFRVGRTRKFFLEAKKPGVNIKDNADPAFQLRRYGWSAALPLSILTDFGEWAVYDCRVEPHQKDTADRARLDYFTYDQLPDKWEWLLTTFGREAVRNGSFDQYAEAKKTAKGSVPVDKAFLRTIESWRALLARDLSWRNQQLSTRELNAAVQMTLDRIIFLRICEDRGIEPYGQLSALTNNLHIYNRLGQVFQQADARYNSGLFHFKAERGREGVPDDWTLKLNVGDDELKTVITRLYFPDSPYVFNQIPADILGQVYEQFLGKVIRLETGHRAVVEDKPEVKKAGGVYYTPTYIVNYIVEHTVDKLLDGKTLREVRGTVKNTTPLRVLDPACGSGSFLIGAYQHLLDWYRAWYTANNPATYKTAVYQSESGAWWLTLAERKQILLDHIFGVDIDTQAVEVTKLSLLLKVLEGETEETLGSYRRLVQQRALPSLEHNIKCGNSLVGSDFYAQQVLPDMDEQLRVNVFDWDGPDGFPAIMGAGGFDAVIGNPPYGAELGQERKHLSEKFKAGTTDTAALMMLQALRLTKSFGWNGMIVPKPFTYSSNWEKVRTLLLDPLVELVDVGKAWKEVKLEQSVYILQHGQKVDQYYSLKRTGQALSHVASISKEECRRFGFFLNSVSNDDLRIAHKMLGCSTFLGSFASNTRGGMFQNLVSPEKGSRSVLGGKQVQRYAVEDSNRCVPPTTQLAANAFVQSGSIIVQNIVAHINLPVDRIKIIGTVANNEIASHAVILDTVNQFINRSELATCYVAGVLFSRLMNWYVYRFIYAKAIRTMHFDGPVSDRIPIRTIDFANPADRQRHDDMVRLVERMLELHTRKAATFGQERTVIERQLAATDRDIDQLVYTLYDLTGEEIVIVEAATQ